MRALISKENKLCILWSPKAGSATACEIFFKYCGNFDYKKHKWIHNARIDYQKAHPEIYGIDYRHMVNKNKYTVLQIVRNPFSRAISSFFYYLTYCENNISFNSFLKKIQNSQLNCNSGEYHACAQFMIDSLSGVIKIENITSDIERINKEFHILLEASKYDEHKWENNMNKIPKKYHGSYENFIDKNSIDLITSIYRKDIEFFNYSCPWKIS